MSRLPDACSDVNIPHYLLGGCSLLHGLVEAHIQTLIYPALVLRAEHRQVAHLGRRADMCPSARLRIEPFDLDYPYSAANNRRPDFQGPQELRAPLELLFSQIVGLDATGPFQYCIRLGFKLSAYPWPEAVPLKVDVRVVKADLNSCDPTPRSHAGRYC